MTTVLFVHGAGAGSYDADRFMAERLQQELGRDYRVDCPPMPDEDEPDYRCWKDVLMPALNRASDDIVALGHSVGGSVLAKLATEEAVSLAGLVLVSAPFWERTGFWRWDEVALPQDAERRLPGGLPLLIYHGADDTTVPIEHMWRYAGLLPRATCHALPGLDHQLCNDLREVAGGIRALRSAQARDTIARPG